MNSWEMVEILARGMPNTVLITLGAFAIGLVLGLPVALARLSRRAALHGLATVYIEVVRGSTAARLDLRGLLRVGTVLGAVADPVFTAIAALGFVATAYMAEIYRAALQSVPSGQLIAGRAIGLDDFSVLLFILLPQAAVLAIPASATYCIGLLKESALASVIGASEITSRHAPHRSDAAWPGRVRYRGGHLCRAERSSGSIRAMVGAPVRRSPQTQSDVMFSHWGEWLPSLLEALITSVTLTAGALAIGLPLGVIIAIAATASQRSVRYLVIVLVELGRGVPALILLYFIYFGLTQVHITLSDTAAVMAALGLNCAAYASEIFRGALEAIPHGQWDGARAIGLSRRAIWMSVILPQMQRNAVPPIIGLSILVFQTTSLAMTIGASDLMGLASNIGSITFRYMSVIMLAALLYAAVSIPASQATVALQRRRDRLPPRPR